MATVISTSPRENRNTDKERGGVARMLENRIITAVALPTQRLATCT